MGILCFYRVQRELPLFQLGRALWRRQDGWSHLIEAGEFELEGRKWFRIRKIHGRVAILTTMEQEPPAW